VIRNWKLQLIFACIFFLNRSLPALLLRAGSVVSGRLMVRRFDQYSGARGGHSTLVEFNASEHKSCGCHHDIHGVECLVHSSRVAVQGVSQAPTRLLGLIKEEMEVRRQACEAREGVLVS